MRVVVTQADIAKARMEVQRGTRSMHCPVAQSLRRRVKEGAHVNVGNHVVDFWTGNGTESVFLPKRARAFIEAFDHDWPVSPFQFDLATPEEVLA